MRTRTAASSAADAALMAVEILHGGISDGFGHRALAGGRRHECRFFGIRAEPKFHENGRHERGYEHAESSLLYATIGSRMHAMQVTLYNSGQVGRLPQMLVLPHVAEDEAKRIVRVGLVVGFELDRRVFHLLDALRVLGSRLGEKVRFETPRGGGCPPMRVRGVHVDRDENLTT